MSKDLILDLGRYKHNCTKRPLIMGILNITPDSFSHDGLYGSRMSAIIKKAMKMEEDGADIIDIGGESSRPFSKPILIKEEILRIIPVIKKIIKKIHIPISVDTYKPQVAKEALDNGAAIINDITALSYDVNMAKIIKEFNATVILMHMQGNPKTMQNKPKYKSVINDIYLYLQKSINMANSFGIKSKKIIIDPGIGFGKTVVDNLRIIKKLGTFKKLNQPILIGISRKSFIGKILNIDVKKRLVGTIASECIAIINGANILRVHDVKETKQMIDICQAISNSQI
ncbi:MAG: dihydropteroate synthase [Candidatus Omnitrophota bacterium]